MIRATLLSAVMLTITLCDRATAQYYPCDPEPCRTAHTIRPSDYWAPIDRCGYQSRYDELPCRQQRFDCRQAPGCYPYPQVASERSHGPACGCGQKRNAREPRIERPYALPSQQPLRFPPVTNRAPMPFLPRPAEGVSRPPFDGTVPPNAPLYPEPNQSTRRDGFDQR